MLQKIEKKFFDLFSIFPAIFLNFCAVLSLSLSLSRSLCRHIFFQYFRHVFRFHYLNISSTILFLLHFTIFPSFFLNEYFQYFNLRFSSTFFSRYECVCVCVCVCAPACAYMFLCARAVFFLSIFIVYFFIL